MKLIKRTVRLFIAIMPISGSLALSLYVKTTGGNVDWDTWMRSTPGPN